MSLRLDELVDVSTFPPREDGTVDLGLTGQRITGARVPLEWVARSWFTPRGVLRNRARGIDLREMENATLGAGDEDRWRRALIAEAEAVEYVDSCAVALTFAERAVKVDANVRLVDGKSYALAVRLSEGRLALTFGGSS